MTAIRNEVTRWFLIQEQHCWMPLSWQLYPKKAEGTYGYKITQDVRQALEVSESTLYPVLEDFKR